jgi:hypothetical protein
LNHFTVPVAIIEPFKVLDRNFMRWLAHERWCRFLKGVL